MCTDPLAPGARRRPLPLRTSGSDAAVFGRGQRQGRGRDGAVRGRAHDRLPLVLLPDSFLQNILISQNRVMCNFGMRLPAASKPAWTWKQDPCLLQQHYFHNNIFECYYYNVQNHLSHSNLYLIQMLVTLIFILDNVLDYETYNNVQ